MTLTRLPEAPLIGLRLELEVPALHKVGELTALPHRATQSTATDPQVSLTTVTQLDGTNWVALRLTATEGPFSLGPRLLDFKLAAPERDRLRLAMPIRHFSCVLQDERLSREARVEIRIQSALAGQPEGTP